MVQIYFDTNGLAANLGYQIRYREIGSIGSYTIYPTNFYSSPAILTLPDSFVGYEGFIAPQCEIGEVTGGQPWSTS